MLIKFALGVNTPIDYTAPKIRLVNDDKATNTLFTSINCMLLDDLNYSIGLSELIHINEYIKSCTILKLSLSDTAPFVKSEHIPLREDLPQMLFYINDFEKNIVKKDFVPSLNKCFTEMSREDMERVENYVTKFNKEMLEMYTLLVKLSNRMYKLTDEEIKSLMKDFDFNALNFTSVLVHKYEPTEKNGMLEFNITLEECKEALRYAGMLHFTTAQHLISIYEKDVTMKQMCSLMLKEDSDYIKTIEDNEKTIKYKNDIISNLNSELREIKSQLSKENYKENSQKDLIDNLKEELHKAKQEIKNLKSQNTFQENEINFLLESLSLNESVENDNSSNISLQEYLNNFCTLKIAIITRNPHFLNNYAKYPNIKPIDVWSTQFDIRPVKDADIVIMDTYRMKHSITYKVRNAMKSDAKFFLSKTSNIGVLDNFIYNILEKNGGNTNEI